jgi:hypothetical protein
MARQNIEEILEKKVAKLREEEKSKKEELAQVQKDLKNYEIALESLKGNIPQRKRKNKEENGIFS